MEFVKIIGEEGPKVQLCNGGSCPTLLVTEDGNVVIQGNKLNPEESSELNVPEHETFVKMPLATLQQMTKHL